MLRPIAEHGVLTIAAGVVLPGVLSALFQFLFASEISGPTSVYSSLAGGGLAGVLVLLANRFDTSNSPASTLETSGTPTTNCQMSVSVEDVTRSAGLDGNRRVYSRRTPSELVDEISGQTSLVAKQRMARHTGQWLRVSGVVRDVEEVSGKGRVILKSTNSQPAIRLQFHLNSHGAVLGSLNVGDRFAALGKIEDIRSSMVILVDCELDE